MRAPQLLWPGQPLGPRRACLGPSLHTACTAILLCIRHFYCSSPVSSMQKSAVKLYLYVCIMAAEQCLEPTGSTSKQLTSLLSKSLLQS